MNIEGVRKMMEEELKGVKEAILEHLDKPKPTLQSQLNSHNYDHGKLFAKESMLESYLRILKHSGVDEQGRKEHELKYAKEAHEGGCEKFMLLCCMNNRETMFRWCDEEQNFIGLQNEVDGKYIYTYHELLEVYDNAIKWIESCRESGMNACEIQVMTL